MLKKDQGDLWHILEPELGEVWNVLLQGDVLVFYQHQTNRNGQPWVGPKQSQFEHVLGLPAGEAMVARAEEIARDVVFFYAQKTYRSFVDLATGAK